MRSGSHLERVKPVDHGTPKQAIEHVSQGTAEIGKAHLLKHFGDLAPEEIRPADSREYARLRMGGALGRQVQGSTVRRELGVLVAALNHAVREQRLRRDHLPSIILPESNPPRERWLTWAKKNFITDAGSLYDHSTYPHIAAPGGPADE